MIFASRSSHHTLAITDDVGLIAVPPPIHHRLDHLKPRRERIGQHLQHLVRSALISPLHGSDDELKLSGAHLPLEIQQHPRWFTVCQPFGIGCDLAHVVSCSLSPWIGADSCSMNQTHACCIKCRATGKSSRPMLFVVLNSASFLFIFCTVIL